MKRDHLTHGELSALLAAARRSPRNGARNALIVEMLSHHCLRPSTLTRVRWDDVDLSAGMAFIDPGYRRDCRAVRLTPGQVAALRTLPRRSEYAFAAEGRAQLSLRQVHQIVASAGARAGFTFRVHPLMLMNPFSGIANAVAESSPKGSTLIREVCANLFAFSLNAGLFRDRRHRRSAGNE